ncbi:MAG: ArsA family ATPase [Candidatus Njordarchaeia archaeon]
MPYGLRYFFEKNPNIRVVIFAGKGGLGKTTSSAALSYHLSQRMNKKVLCFSTDPQASLSDIFVKDIFGKGVMELKPNLYVVEIDADRKIKEYQEEIKQKIIDMYKLEELPREIGDYIDAAAAEPAMYESATYDAMADLVAKEEYEVYVFDMPPFGHGVRMVAMAEILTAWVEKITETRKEAEEYEAVAASLKGGSMETEDLIMNELMEIRNKMKAFTDILTDKEKTAFFMVLVPEKMAILDTERALDMFEFLGIRLSGVVVNQVYPASLLDDPNTPEFLKNRVEMQQKYLEEIKDKFHEYIAAVLPMYDREPKGFDMLEIVSKDLWESPIEL